MITIGIDSSTTNCGFALYDAGVFKDSDTFSFDGKYDLSKLEEIADVFHSLFEFWHPGLVIIEEPINVRNKRAAMSLSQVAGAIASKAWNVGATVNFLHNKTVKSLMGFKTKEESIALARKIGNVANEHEADAVMLVEAYKKLISQ